MIKIVAITGSPSTGGNTDKLLARFLEGAEDAGGQVRNFAIAELEIEGWTPEVECPEAGLPQVEDDFSRVSREIVAADVVVVASPIYFRNVPAQLKAMIDRGQCQWIRKYVDKKPLPPSAAGHRRRRGVFLAVGGSDREHFGGATQTIKSFFDVYEVDYWQGLFFGGIDAPGDADKQPLAFQETYDLGFRAVTEAWE